MTMSILLSHSHRLRLVPLPRSSSSSSPSSTKRIQTPPILKSTFTNLPNLLMSSLSIGLLSLTLTLNTTPLPSLAIPSLTSQSPPKNAISPTTPFSQSKDLPLGVQDGKIRPCPSTNPGCVSSNPKSSSFAFPWSVPPDITSKGQDYVLQQLKEAVLTTQKNPKILVSQDTPFGHYLQAEVDGGFNRDVLEFLVKGDVVSYRCMATKVTYVYPFTTALGDSKGQEERLKRIIDQLGWFAPGFEGMD